MIRTTQEQQTFNKNIVKRIQELENKKPSKLDDQIDIKFMKQDEWSEHINELLEGIDKILEENDKMTDSLDIAGRLNRSNHKRLRDEFEEFKESTVKRLDQVDRNRTKAFERIEELENKIELMERYSIGGLKKDLRDLQYETDIKLERNDEIRAVHRNEIDNQRKNFNALQKVWDETVMNLLEKGEHEKEKG